MLDEALGHLVRGIVDNPDDVSVSERSGRRGTTLEVSVNPADMGRVIGRSGRTATALALIRRSTVAVAYASTSSTWQNVKSHRARRCRAHRSTARSERRGDHRCSH